MSAWTIASLRSILETETDADSPVSQELMDQFRENFEALVLLLYGTGITGTVTTIAEEVLTDSGQAYDVDLHINHTVLITSGDAIGNMYTIDDNAATTLTCTGDTMVTDGVAINDTFAILYDMKVNADGHDHDGDNSREVVFSKGRVNVIAQGYPANELSSHSTTYETVLQCRIYIPSTANTLYAEYNIKSGTVSNNSYACIDVVAPAGASAGVFRTVTTYGWTDEDSLDVSGVAEGWTTLNIQLKSPSAGVTTYIDGFTVTWGP